MSKILARLKEPSSYAAVAAVLAMVGVNVDADLWKYVVGLATAIAGLAGFFLNEKSGT